jgi:hypothetical protein
VIVSQFPRRLRVGDYTVVHFRTGNRGDTASTVTIRTELIQQTPAATVTMRLPPMEIVLRPSEGTNAHIVVPIDGRFRDGPVRVAIVFESEGRRRPSGTAHLDRLEIAGRRPRPFSGAARLCPSIEAVKLAALYIAAIEYADLARLLDDWDTLPPSSLEHRCKLDALAIDQAVRQLGSPFAEPSRTETGRSLMSCYEADRDGFTVGYARRDVPFMLGWHKRAGNGVARLIRARGLVFESESEWGALSPCRTG